MTTEARIADLPTLGEGPATVRGWVMRTRSSGKIGFIVVRDGSGYLQAVLLKQDVAPSCGSASSRSRRRRPSRSRGRSGRSRVRPAGSS